MARSNLTRIPLLLVAIIPTLFAKTFNNCWKYCVVGHALKWKVWPGLKTSSVYDDSPVLRGDDNLFGVSAVAQYLDISWTEAVEAYADGYLGWTKKDRIKRTLRLALKYLIRKGDTQ